MRKVIMLSVLLLLVFVFAIIYMQTRRCERFNVATTSTPVQILTSQETRDCLSQDADGYVRSLSYIDLYARRSSSHDEYKKKAIASAVSPDQNQAQQIRDAIDLVDAFLSSPRSSSLSISPYKLQSIPWKIAVTSGKDYEEGLPHTRYDVIFINTHMIPSSTLASTLLHEKVHIFQRMYIGETEQWLQRHGYKRLKHKSSEPLARSNPDLDDWIYFDTRTQTVMMALYNNEKPVGITDVRLMHPSFEHPNEYMAYEVADNFFAKSTTLPSNP